jgi:tetratricopeptide (TPR) repeat protein
VWAGVSDATEAHRHWGRVRALLADVEASPETLELGVVARCALLEFGLFVGMSAEEATRLLDEGQRLAQGAGVPALLARLLGAYAAAKGMTGDLDAYQRFAQEAARVADATDDPRVRADAQAPVAFSRWLAGRLREALATCNAALDWAPRRAAEDGAWHFEAYTFLFATRGRILHDMGRLREGAEDLEHALRLALQNDDTENVAWTLMAQAETAARNLGDAHASLKHARRAFEMAERTGSSFDRGAAIQELGLAQLASGQWSAAVDSEERALAIMRETGTGLGFEPWVLMHLAEALLGAGDHTAARERVEEGLERARAQSSPKAELELLLLRAQVLARAEGESAHAQIEQDLDRAQALIQETSYRVRQPLLHERRADLARLEGDDAEQERELHEALRLYTEMGATGHAARVKGQLSR